MVGIHWSEREEQTLIKTYGKDPIDKIQRILSTRTYMAIAAKAKRLKINRPQHHSNKTLSDYEKGFLEATIDGEGTVSLYCNHNKSWSSYRGFSWVPFVAVSNTNLGFLEKVKEICGGGRLYLKTRKNPPRNQKAQYIYEMNRGVMRHILPQISLVIKEKQRQLLMEALGLLIQGGNSSEMIRQIQVLNDKRLEQVYKEMRLLNKRGLD